METTTQAFIKKTWNELCKFFGWAIVLEDDEKDCECIRVSFMRV